LKFALLFLPLCVIAHDIWIEKQDRISVLRYGHLHPSQEHKGNKIIPYAPKKIKEIICRHGTESETLNIPRVYPVRIRKHCDALYITLDNGYFTKTPYGTKNLPKNRLKMSLKSWRSIESVRRVDSSSDTLLSSGLELVLLKRPSKAGEKATLQIFYNKKPLSGILVAYDGSVRGLSNKEGKINIRIRHSGLQNIQATYKQKAANRKLADETVRTATLNFEIAE